MQTILDTPAYRGDNRYKLPFDRLDPRRQLTVLIDVFGTRHLHRDKPVSFTTKKHRAYASHQVLSDLREAGYNIKSIRSLDQRHVQALVDTWRERGYKPGTMQLRFSQLRWLATAVGKRGLVRDPSCYGLEASDTDRSYVASEDKSWTGRGLIPDDLIKEAAGMDAFVSVQLELMREFGLRVTEAILMRPRASHVNDSLVVELGTKGRRSRVVPIQSDSQRAALARAEALSVSTARGALVPPGRTPAQARRRLYYICGKLGITKAQLGVTCHGLRHQFANDQFEKIAGAPSPVRGGSTISDPAAEDRARQHVTRALGHERTSVTAAYTGRAPRRARQVPPASAPAA